jgi:hypothetical protein
MVGPAERAVEGAAPRPWNAWHRIGFRFVCVYLVLYELPFPLDIPPKTQWLDDAVTWVWHKLGVFVGDLVFGVDITVFSNGSGDTTYDWVMLFTMASLAAIAAAAWTLADRRRVDYRKLDAMLRVFIRYALGVTMMGYGFAKVFKTQFPFPSPDRLQSTYGESSPMGLLWTMMGYSTPYNVFTGGIEVLGGMLLFWRRTQLLGALVCAGALANIVMLNVCYDVPVKLFSTHLLLMSVYVMAPDLGRLAALLVFHRAIPAAPPRRRLPRRWAIARVIVKVLFIGYVLYTEIKGELDMREMIAGGGDLAPPVVGVFTVDELAIDGAVHPPLTTDAARWRTLAINPYGGVMVRHMDSSSERFAGVFVPGTAFLHPYKDAPPIGVVFRMVDASHAVVGGVFDKHWISARLTLQDGGDSLLVSRGFHWINEYPLNR